MSDSAERRGRFSSIQFKIVAIVILVLLLGAGSALVITLRNQRQDLLDATQNTLSLNTDMLVTVIRSIMLSGEAPVAQQTMEGLAGLQGSAEIGLYRTDGTVAFHDYATVEQVNAFQDMVIFEQTPRAELKRLEGEYFQEVLRSRTPVQVENTQARELEYFFPILNYNECRQCHGDQGFIRGVAHFKVSIAGIYDQISLARRILTGLFVIMGVAIAVVMILSLNRVIVSPILRIGEIVTTVGSGNLETSIDVRSRDEIGSLGEKINAMIGGLRERDHLIIENERIETRNRENRKYLDNIQEGLLLIGSDLRTSEQFSEYMTTLFRTDDIAGRSIVDFLYPDGPEQAQEREELERFLGMLFENTNAEMDMVMQINPLDEARLTIRGSDGEPAEIIISALYHRIWGDDPGIVENVMVIFQDRTDITHVQEELQVERARSQSEVEHIAALLRAGPQAFVDFVDQARAALGELAVARDRLGDRDVGERIFRGMHSLKGAARYLDFIHIADTAHAIEDIVALSRKTGDTDPDAAARLEALTANLGDEIDGVAALNDRFRSFAVQDVQDPHQSLKDFLKTLRRMAVGDGEELGKKVTLKAYGDLSDPQLLSALRNPIIHLVRNAVDHGIEDPMERLAAGKEETGQVSLRFGTRDDARIIEIADDGGGIDFKAVRNKAVEVGLIDAGRETTRQELAALLFKPSFSSRDKVSDISGRGVGLDVVQSSVRELGGEVLITTRPGEGTKFTLRLP